PPPTMNVRTMDVLAVSRTCARRERAPQQNADVAGTRKTDVSRFSECSPAGDANAASITRLRHVPLAASSSRYQFARAIKSSVTTGYGPTRTRRHVCYPVAIA